MGRYKGFTNEGVSSLFKMEGGQGPLDFSKNEARADSHHYNLAKIANKIEGTMNQLQQSKQDYHNLEDKI